MTIFQKKKINFSDRRGYIRDLFQNSPKDHCSIVTFNKGAVRGNHYHKKSTQYSYLLSGKLTLRYSKVDKNGNIKGKINKKIIGPNILIIHRPYEAHAFIANKKSLMIAFADGLRGGKDYEKDTYRLKYKIIK
tara:strand:+ start:38 stop:436 length:399 start_codon:yes stop_codon:yes gene_type:complete